jgi:hypothetical protein
MKEKWSGERKGRAAFNDQEFAGGSITFSMGVMEWNKRA